MTCKIRLSLRVPLISLEHYSAATALVICESLEIYRDKCAAGIFG